MTKDPKLAPAEVIAPTIDFQAYLFPDETEAEYVEFTRPIVDELAPSSALQRRIAANIADLEWEAMRYRRLTSQTMGDGYSHSAKTALSNLQRENTITGGDVGKIMKSLRSSDQSARANASNVMETLGIGNSELMARAYGRGELILRHLEGRIIETERRRKSLMKEYQDLCNIKRAAAIPDAEIIE